VPRSPCRPKDRDEHRSRGAERENQRAPAFRVGDGLDFREQPEPDCIRAPELLIVFGHRPQPRRQRIVEGSAFLATVAWAKAVRRKIL
jgi:hypothetical protein